MIFYPGRHIRLLFLGLVCFCSAPVHAQKERSFLKTADSYFMVGNYRAAIPYYEQVLNSDKAQPLALYRAGVSYLAYDKDRASDYLYKAQRLNPNVAPDIEYWLGRADHVNYRFDDAVEHYKLYANTLPKNAQARKEVDLLIQQSRTAQKFVQKPKDLFVRNLGPTINSPFSDHSPVISRDNKTLIYTTRNRTAVHEKVNTDGEYTEEIVEAVRLDADTWSEPRSLNLHLNSKGHDASIQLFDNDTRLLMYRQSQNGDFYVARRKESNWSLPEKLNGHINTPNYESDAFITHDNNTLYFATTHFSKKGDKDLFMSRKDANGVWGKPVSLGNTINTAFDEDSPFLTPDGKTLYFTSRGHNTMGGYDVFVSHLDSVTQTWSAPENMGYPINSPDDDTYFRLNADGTMAYLSSYRMGGYGEKDIWSIDLSKEVKIKGQVANAEKVDATTLEINFTSRPKNNRALQYYAPVLSTGDFEIQLQSGRTYQVTFKQNGQVISTQEYEVPATAAPEVVKTAAFRILEDKLSQAAPVKSKK
ncbi:PD40 domain-containing protein [Adhaeribacter swui]|uniref:PD40 domain-containing protein n=1 Tax=Adhaeribacter swui TaxID=2086471 RepID=A0A7G7GCN0_9BACT|nr:PD40 domain-containing protein [Adhaeribacter swui]QNF34914.1 PD40 domain-containing protein [Adhaeribacter swui]